MNTTIEMIRDVFDTYGQQNPDKINKVYSYCSRESILNLVTWLGELKDFNYKDCEEFIKQKNMTEVQKKIDDIEESHKIEINKINEVNQMQINCIKENMQNEKYIYKEQMNKESEEKKEIMSCMNDMKNKSNICKGQEGESVVEDALLTNNKYDDMNIKNVTQDKGSGDFIVTSEKYNLNIMVEVKNHKYHVPTEHVNTFVAHYSNYFQENSYSHAIMFSINCKSISGKGSYKRETVIVNNRNHHILYISLAGMTKEFIIENFNIFTQQICEENSALIPISASNTALLGDIANTKNNTDHLYDVLDAYNYSKQYNLSEYEAYNEKIEKIEKLIQINIDFMKERNFIYNKNVINIIYLVLQTMRNDGIEINSIDSFKQSFKKKYSSISNFSNNYNSSHYISKFISTYRSYESMYNILSSVNI
jgi:hypothetical protein